MLLPEQLTGFTKTKIKYHHEEGQTYKGGQFLQKFMRKQHGKIRAGKGGIFLKYFNNPQLMYYKKSTLSTTYLTGAPSSMDKPVVFWEIWLGRRNHHNDWHHFWLSSNGLNDTLVKHFLMSPKRITKNLEMSKCKFRVATYKKMIHGIFMQLYEHARHDPESHRFCVDDNKWAMAQTGYFLDIEKEQHYFKGRITTPFKNTEEKLFNISKIMLRIDRGDSKKGHQLCQKPMTDKEKRHFNFENLEAQTAINYRFKVPDMPLTAEIFKMLKLKNGDISTQFHNFYCWEIRNLGIRILAFLNAITNNRKVASSAVNKMDSKEWFDTTVWVWDARSNYYYERE